MKLRYDQLPPRALRAVVERLTHGLNKGHKEKDYLDMQDFENFNRSMSHGNTYLETKEIKQLIAYVTRGLFELEKQLIKEENNKKELTKIAI
ncbi:MAG: hypothetical protein KBA02_00200 [Paludibacteraceae bacterium]|nr:hypothetical protein [Paludibacteraceae bacterium]